MKIRTYLLLVGVAISVPIVIFSTIALNMLLASERRAALRSLDEMARATALVVERELGSAEAALRVLALSPHLTVGESRRFYDHAKAADRGEEGRTILFADNGQQIINTVVPFGSGSYVVLSLPPGRHTLTRLSENRWKDTGYDRHDLEIDTAAGKSYYVGASNGLSLFSALQEDGVEAGEKFLQHAQLANFYFVPVSLDGFLAQSAARKAQRTEAGSQPSAAPPAALATVRPPQSASAPALQRRKPEG